MKYFLNAAFRKTFPSEFVSSLCLTYTWLYFRNTFEHISKLFSQHDLLMVLFLTYLFILYTVSNNNIIMSHCVGRRFVPIGQSSIMI